MVVKFRIVVGRGSDETLAIYRRAGTRKIVPELFGEYPWKLMKLSLVQNSSFVEVDMKRW